MKSLVAVGLVSAVVAHGATATPSAFKPPRPRTLVTVSGPIVGFAQDGNHIVWGNGYAPCGRIVQLRTLSTGASRFLDTRKGPMCDEVENGGMQHTMALAGTRALWAYVDETFSQAYFTLFAAAPGDRTERSVGGWSIDLDDPLGGPVPMASDGRTPIFARVPPFALDTDFGVRSSGVYRVYGQRTQYVAGTKYAFDVAAAGSRIALARRIPGGCSCNWAPAWSPDGRRIAFISGRAQGRRSQLFSMNADSSDLRLLMDDVFQFAWAPDGAAIAALQGVGETPDKLVVGRPDGSAPRTIRRGAFNTGPFVWSPDGRRLAYIASVGRKQHLYVVPASGGAATDLGVVGGTAFAWSPDSRRLAYTRFVGEQPRLYVVVASGGAADNSGDGQEPSWSPDGSAIAFSRADGLYAIASDGSNLRRIATASWPYPVWSPDGRWIAFTDSGGEQGLWIVGPEGGLPRELAVRGYLEDWSPDSSAIAFTSESEAVTIADVDTGALRPIGPGSQPRWSSDSSRLAYAAGRYDQREIAVVDAVGNPLIVTRTEPAPERMAIETRSRDGRPQSSFDGSSRLAGLAFSGSRVALVVGRSKSRATIEIRTTAGTLLRRADVPRPAWGDVSMSGRWIVFWSQQVKGKRDNIIRLIDAETGRTTILARIQATVVGLSIDDRRVAWAEQGSRVSRIRAVMLPHGYAEAPATRSSFRK